MIRDLFKRLLKAACSPMTVQRLLQHGPSRTAACTLPTDQSALVDEADAAAAAALDVEDDDDGLDPQWPSADPSANAEAIALPTPAATQMPSHEAVDTCPAPADGETALLRWIHRQRQSRQRWADVVLAASAAGHTLPRDDLRRCYRSWCVQYGQAKNDSTPPSPPSLLPLA